MVRPVAPLFEYVVYEDYIAEFLCTNKDLKELNCNGKCYLMERLADENQNKKENLPRIVLEEYPIGFVELTGIKVFNGILENCSEQNHYKNNYLYLFAKGVFHPPNLLS